jgi:hypothetical protein
MDVMVASVIKGAANIYDAAFAFVAYHMKLRMAQSLEPDQTISPDIANFLPALRQGFERTRCLMTFPAELERVLMNIEEFKLGVDQRARPS